MSGESREIHAIIRLTTSCGGVLGTVAGVEQLDYNKLKDEDFQIKSYLKTMNIKDSRMIFSLRVKMTSSIQTQSIMTKHLQTVFGNVQKKDALS